MQGWTFKRQLHFWWPDSKNWLKMIGKNIKINDIFEWHKIISFDIECWWNEHFWNVLRMQLRDWSRQENSNRKCNDNGQRKYNLKTIETKTEHKNWHRSIISWQWWNHSRYFLDSIFPKSTKLSVFQKCNYSKQ